MDEETKTRFEAHDTILTRIELQQEKNTLDIARTQASISDLEAIVENLAKTVDKMVNAIMASGRLNGKGQQP